MTADDSSFVFKPAATWRSKVAWCFRSLKDPSRPMFVHYF